MLKNEGIGQHKIANIVIVSYNDEYNVTVLIRKRKCKIKLKSPSVKRAKKNFHEETGVELQFL